MENSDCIIEGLYLGGVMAALNEKDLEAKKITHILSVDEKPLPDILTNKYTYKHVFALDLYDFDLLNLFPECFQFIDQAVDGHCNVFVHCQAGMSRSATVVIGYLMYKQGVSKSKAMEMVAARRPLVKPNEGFQEQLQLFENMGGQMERSHPEFRAYQLNKLAVKFKCGQYAHGVPESDIPSDVYVQPDLSGKGGDFYFKCRKCRIFLFHEGAITLHNVGEGESAFDWRSKVPVNKRPVKEGEKEPVACTRSLFVSPLAWMKGKIHMVQGKLFCPKCEIKIGSYVWFGEKCPCGAWVAPAFHVNNSKVDKIPSQPVMPRTHAPVRPVVPVGAAARLTPPPGRVRGEGETAGTVVGSAGMGRPVTQLSETTTAAAAAARLSSAHPDVAIATVTPLPPSTPVAMATVMPLQSMEVDSEAGDGVSRSRNHPLRSSDNQDLESGISSINMDVDSG